MPTSPRGNVLHHPFLQRPGSARPPAETCYMHPCMPQRSIKSNQDDYVIKSYFRANACYAPSCRFSCAGFLQIGGEMHGAVNAAINVKMDVGVNVTKGGLVSYVPEWALEQVLAQTTQALCCTC